MSYLLDTDHCSYLQRKHPEVLKHFEALPPRTGVVTSVITEAELRIGIHLAASERRRQELAAHHRELVSDISDILLVTQDVARHFARIFAELRRKGTPIPTNDIWIAAIALAHDRVLVSHDAHFQHVEGLVVVDWTVPVEG